MFVLPLDRGIDWRHPPVATLILAALSLVAFVVFQLDDREEARAAREYYFDSGLAAIELPAYRHWLTSQGRGEEIDWFGEDTPYDPRRRLYHVQRRDAAFQQALKNGEVIDEDHDAYWDWRDKRRAFEQRMADYTVDAWGLKPNRLDWPNLVTHQFLHGGVMHLVGNMVFLVAAGLLVEMVAGAAVMTGVYILGGIGAGLAFILWNPGASAPLVGASGSISAVMGGLAVAYGLNRVRVFINIGFYVDSRRVPALLLFIPWIGLQWLLMELAGDRSSVAYTAHIGGYLAGAVLMAPVRLLDSGMDERARESESAGEAVQDQLDRAGRALARLDVDDASVDYQQVLARQPDNHKALRGLYYCYRLQPASEAYHETARRILRLTDPAAAALMREVYHDYRRRARPRPRLAADIMANLAARFLNDRALDEADQLLALMVRRTSAFPQIRQQVGELIRLLREAGREERAAAWAATAKTLD